MGKDCTDAHSGRIRTRTVGEKKYVNMAAWGAIHQVLLDELKDSICGHWTDPWWWLTHCHVQERLKDSLLELGKT